MNSSPSCRQVNRIKSRPLLASAVAAAMLALPCHAEKPVQTTSKDEVGVFGIAASAAAVKTFPTWIPQMTAIGIRDLRSPRTSWNMVQPKNENEWNWDLLDQQLDYLESQGVRSVGLFLGTAADWNKEDHPRGLPLNKLDAWSKYVYEIVKKAKGRITYWEVWNEPPNGTRNAPAADYAKVVAATYKAAKAADPNCKIGMAAKSVHVNYLEQAIKAGAKDHFDFITLHPYESLGCVQRYPGTEPIFLNIIPTLRRMLAAQNPEKKDVPVWFTEIGFDTKHGDDQQVAALVKAFTMGIAQGVQSIDWYEGIDGDSGDLGLLRKDGSERPAYTAMAQMIKILGQHPKYLGWLQLDGKHFAFAFQGATGPVLVTWPGTPDAGSVNFGAKVKIIEPATGQATEAESHKLTAPVIVTSVPAKILAEAAANVGKPYPWGGDFSKAESVSVAMEEKLVESGLHVRSAAAAAADVIAYGGSARAGSVPGGNIFSVDPNFLIYDAVPLEITAVVRRNKGNKPAKVELEYESTDGFKKTTPYEIPDNTQWHNATWRINDSQFVSMWAYNFRLNSGDYLIQSVTVKKLKP